MHYSDHELKSLLVDRPLGDFRPDELQHLENCHACQQRLAGLSGAGEWILELAESVNEETSDFYAQPEWASPPNSVLISVDSSEQTDNQLQCEPVHLDFLEAANHPELLGRLGRYDIERLIGMGGFGIVFKARDSELNRVVAVKVLAPHLVHSGPARQRFAREAQASAAVVHDHVVPIHDVVSTADACYLVMQYIPGHSLQDRVDEHGPLPVAQVLRIAAQMAAGLHEAHKQGLIHRDVKPGNVLLEDSVDRVLISDFGLARAADDASLTRSGVITGTPNYMSPEQARGSSIDARSDLFSLGSVIYFMTTGHSPFRAPQMMAVLNRICHESYRPLTEVNQDVPIELASIVDRLLTKSPADRYQDAKTVQRELERLLSDFQCGKIRPRRAITAKLAVTRPFAKTALTAIAIGVLAIAAFGGWTAWPANHEGPGKPTDTAAENDSGGSLPYLAAVTGKTDDPQSDLGDDAEVQDATCEQEIAVVVAPVDPEFMARFTYWADDNASFSQSLMDTQKITGVCEQCDLNGDAHDLTWDSDVFSMERVLQRLEKEFSRDTFSR